jgi:hypothetical protein
MAKKSFNQEESKPIDYFHEVKATQKQEKSSVSNLVTTLRSDMIPASEEEPARKSIFERENLRIAVGILLGLVIIGWILYTIAGPGRPILERNLANLVHKVITPTQNLTTSPLPATNTRPQPSNTPNSSPTIRPTKTPVVAFVASPTPLPATTTPTSSPSCRDVLSITLADVGQTICVQGVVIQTVTYPTYFMVVFSNKAGAFYWVSYDLVWSQAKLNTCYQVHGIVKRIGNSPVLLFNLSNLPEACP